MKALTYIEKGRFEMTEKAKPIISAPTDAVVKVTLSSICTSDLHIQRDRSTIQRHIKKIYEEGELTSDSTCAFFATVQNEGQRKVERNIAYYNLDMIISVGYRVNSHRGVQFRQ